MPLARISASPPSIRVIEEFSIPEATVFVKVAPAPAPVSELLESPVETFAPTAVVTCVKDESERTLRSLTR